MQYIELSWTAAARATSYEVYYSTGNDFSTATKFAQEPTGTSVTVTGLADNTAYNFWVTAKNAGGAAAESRMYNKAEKTSEPIPAFLLAGLALSGKSVAYFKASNYNDAYRIEDLGADYPLHERYPFGYMGGPGMVWYHPGVIAFVRSGCIVYRYMVNGREKFHATYYSDPHLDKPKLDYQDNYSTPPAAVMGQANGYASGMNDDPTDTLQEALDKYAHRGGPPGGSGGYYDYQSPMRIYYGYVPDYIP
jgi:hypothetical protein